MENPWTLFRDRSRANWSKAADQQARRGHDDALVSPLLNNLFGIARAKYQAENQAWVQLSFRLSGRFNLPTAMPSIQREGNLDIPLRCLTSGCMDLEEGKYDFVKKTH